MNVHVNGNCIGCGLCVNMCGAVFLMTEEGVAAARDTIYPRPGGLCPGGGGELPGQRHRNRRIVRSKCRTIFWRSFPATKDAYNH